MRKRVFGRHLKRDTNERKALFKNLMTELILHEKIITTQEKAKAIRGQVEKLITKAKRKGQQAEYLLQPYLSTEAVKKLIADLAPHFANRPGGYTRIIKTGNRFNDNASMAIIALVGREELRITKHESPTEQNTVDDMSDIQEAEIVKEEPKKRKASKGTSANADEKEIKKKKAAKKEKKK